MYEKNSDNNKISEKFTFFINSLLSQFQPKGNVVKIKKIDYPNSFNLIIDIILNNQYLCISSKKNKEILLVEIFKLFFPEEKGFKNINDKDLETFFGLISFYEHRFSWTLNPKINELENKNIDDKQFIELMETFLRKDDNKSFIYSGLTLLDKKGFTVQNLLKYIF